MKRDKGGERREHLNLGDEHMGPYIEWQGQAKPQEPAEVIRTEPSETTDGGKPSDDDIESSFKPDGTPKTHVYIQRDGSTHSDPVAKGVQSALEEMERHRKATTRQYWSFAKGFAWLMVVLVGLAVVGEGFSSAGVDLLWALIVIGAIYLGTRASS